jgi:hypothetical protein
MIWNDYLSERLISAHDYVTADLPPLVKAHLYQNPHAFTP